MKKEILNNEELKKISDTISKVESQTSGEICVVLKKKKSLLDFNKSPRELALHEFKKNKLDSTQDRSAVLIYILLKDHKFEIIADIGIESKVAPFYWSVLSDAISERFKNNDFCTGICDFINEIGIVLIKEFPIKKDDKNELSNEVIF